MQLNGAERFIRSGVGLVWDLAVAIALQAVFDHTWWLSGMRLDGMSEISLFVELAFFLCLWRFVVSLIFGLSWGQWIAGLSSQADRLVLAGSVWVEFLLSPLLPVSALLMLSKRVSLSELIFGPLLRTRLAPRKVELLLTRLPLGLALLILGVSFHGVISRQSDTVRVGGINQNPLVVNYEKGRGSVYSSNRFRVRLVSDLRNTLGVRRVSLIPSFEVERRLGKKLFYPELVIFDRETKSFAALTLYKEIEYSQFLARASSLDPTWTTRYPRMVEGLKKSQGLSSMAEGRDFQNFLTDIFDFDSAPISNVLKAPLSSRSRSRALFDLFNLLDLGFSPMVNRMVLSNESFVRLQGTDAMGEEREYWLSTRGPKLRVFELAITKGSGPWSTAEIAPVLFKEAKWDWFADLPFPVALLKDEINALSVVDLYTKQELSAEEREEIEKFLFFHYFELARDSLLFKQEELQRLLIDTLERFLIIAKSPGREKNTSLYSKRFQKKLTDLKESLALKDHNYYKIQ